MRHYSLLKTIPLSFYSKALYRDVGHEWPGLGFGYLLVAVSAFIAPFLVYLFILSLQGSLASAWGVDVNYVIDQIPEITIKGGEISTTVPQPYYIRLKTGKTLAIIDTTRPVTDWAPRMAASDTFMVVGKKEVLTRQRNGEKKLIDVDPKMDGTYTREDARTWAATAIKFAWIIPLFIAPFMTLALFLYRIVQMFLYGLPGWLISTLSKAGLTYTACVRVASVAITPVLLLEAIDMYTPLHLSGWIYFLLAMGYLFYGIRASRPA